jgi:TPR repeat protein
MHHAARTRRPRWPSRTSRPPGSETPPEPKNNETAETVESLKAQLAQKEEHITKLNDESKKHRLSAKEKSDLLEKATTREAALKKALGLGEADPVEEKLVEVKKQADDKNKRVLLKAAVMAAVGKDAHDPEAVWQLAQPKLKEVSVDLDTETVDSKALSSVLDAFKKEKTFLFAQPAQGGGAGAPPMPGGNGVPGSVN